MNKSMTKAILNKEFSALDDMADSIKRSNHNLDGSKHNNWQVTNTVANEIMNQPSWTDLDDSDVTSLVKSDAVDNYGLADTDNAINSTEQDIADAHNNNDHDAAQDSRVSLDSLSNVHGDWSEDRGLGHGTDNYFTDLTSESALKWIKDIKKILQGDLDTCSEA